MFLYKTIQVTIAFKKNTSSRTQLKYNLRIRTQLYITGNMIDQRIIWSITQVFFLSFFWGSILLLPTRFLLVNQHAPQLTYHFSPSWERRKIKSISLRTKYATRGMRDSAITLKIEMYNMPLHNFSCLDHLEWGVKNVRENNNIWLE